MPLVDWSSPPSQSALDNQMDNDCVLNTSPIPSRDLNPASNCCDSQKEQCFDFMASPLSNGKMNSRPSTELVNEIAILEVQIQHLERYLLSLYRSAFEQDFSKILNNVELMNETSSGITSDQSSEKMNLRMLKDSSYHQEQSSPTSSLVGPNDLVYISSSKPVPGREKESVYPSHLSLAEHLGKLTTNDALICPDRLSEDIIRCISSIYCKVANLSSHTYKGSVSSTSSFCSSSTFSPRNLSGSWSPQCNDEVAQNCDFEGLKQENGPYAAMVEVVKICLDDESHNYAATMLQKFRSLVKSLEIVDPMKMRREAKLAFWTNIHNALVMHGYLAYGTQQYLKSTSSEKAAYNVGGHCINAYDIRTSILGIRTQYSSPWLQTLLSPGKKSKTGNSSHVYNIEYAEPLLHFALSSGAYSDPAVRVYRANNVFEDLKIAKEEFIQATVYVHKETKIYLPRLVYYYGKDMSLGMTELLEMVCECLPNTQQKAIRNCVDRGKSQKQYVCWLNRNPSFRYLIDKETVMASQR